MLLFYKWDDPADVYSSCSLQTYHMIYLINWTQWFLHSYILLHQSSYLNSRGIELHLKLEEPYFGFISSIFFLICLGPSSLDWRAKWALVNLLILWLTIISRVNMLNLSYSIYTGSWYFAHFLYFPAFVCEVNTKSSLPTFYNLKLLFTYILYLYL